MELEVAKKVCEYDAIIRKIAIHYEAGMLVKFGTKIKVGDGRLISGMSVESKKRFARTLFAQASIYDINLNLNFDEKKLFIDEKVLIREALDGLMAKIEALRDL